MQERLAPSGPLGYTNGVFRHASIDGWPVAEIDPMDWILLWSNVLTKMPPA